MSTIRELNETETTTSSWRPTKHEASASVSGDAGAVAATLNGDQAVTAGYGHCRSCDCSGYESSGDGKRCQCGHHFSQHR